MEGQVVVLWLVETQGDPGGGTVPGNTSKEPSGAFGGRREVAVI